jgi:hypothetical protein
LEYQKRILHIYNVYISDLLSDYPDKKSILMYVMCLFQQLPSSNIVIEEKETALSDEESTMETKV